MKAGARTERVELYSPAGSDDGYGGETVTFVFEFETEAAVLYLRGGETVQAARLEGRQPAVFTIAADSRASQVRPSWRLTDVRTGREFNIRSVILSEDAEDYELTCEGSAA